MKSYDHKEVEPKWQEYWQKEQLFLAGKFSDRPKKYWLETFPYPSAAGLHVGHPRGYTASDISARYYRMKGFDVLYPIGWDAFGLPTENYAIKNGISPQQATDDNVANFTRQLKAFGFSYDWTRVVNTSAPSYYKWTQWLFKTLFDNGYAYQKEAHVNWCPKDQTVLANEQVVDGKCERCGTVIEQRKLNQWFFKTTDFAEELLTGLDNLDWPESTKAGQRNWVGKSVGAQIEFAVEGQEFGAEVFTTRPDTLFGATFLVVSPELAKTWIEGGWQAESSVTDYVSKSLSRLERDRLEGAGEKTGVSAGLKALHPITKEPIPIWVADYVVGSYGTGAIMAVPAHDERDFAFATKFGLSIVAVVESGDQPLPTVAKGALINSREWNGWDFDKVVSQIGAGAYSWAKAKTQYKLRDWSVSRQRYWGTPIPIVYDPTGTPVSLLSEELPLILPTDVNVTPTGEPPLAKSVTFQEGVEDRYGKAAKRSVETLDTFVDSAWYYLRYCDPTNELVFASPESLAKWMPVDTYVIGAEHTNMHLLYARYITKALHRLGYLSFDEPFLKVRHQGLILGSDGEKMSKSKGNVINPDELIAQYGADTVRMYEMFMGPFDQNVAWDTNGVSGVRKFLDRLYKKASETVGKTGEVDEGSLHRLIKKVSEDIEAMKFNTIVSSCMEYLNGLGDESGEWVATVTKLIAPVAPHMAEELWQGVLGNKDSVFVQAWPSYDPAKIKTAEVVVVVQRNGKTRGNIIVPAGLAEADIITMVAKDEKLVSASQSYSKVIYVADKIINFVGE